MRVLLHGLRGGFLAALGPGRDPAMWIRENIGLANAQLYEWSTPYCPDGFALYCRTLGDAALFLEAFPEFEIADGTTKPIYNSPHVFEGQRKR